MNNKKSVNKNIRNPKESGNKPHKNIFGDGVYDPKEVEDKIYKEWEDSGYFNPDNLEGEPYSIMMPPPNVTGVLHLGHAMENTLMDIMARYQRMQGKKVLLLPGTDHAAVATQAKVEKILMEKGMKNPRRELGREKLLEKIREYAENSKATILKQIKKMGVSCDWSRLAYTFDKTRGRAVNEVFARMFHDGLIYRGYRVVNWSIKGQCTCSDDELVYIERPAKLYTFKYSHDFPISIATTRPETKLGDTAVAVNPNDKRYKKYIGKIFTADVGAEKPLKIKIISDESVDMNFGTGAVGVTPAHSMADFEIYEKQKAKGDPIGFILVIDEQGLVNAGKNYAGLAVEKAREKFVGWLKENNLLEKEEEITQNVGTSDRFGDVAEVLPKIQWFVAVNKEIPGRKKTLKDLMKEAVTTGHQSNPEQKIKITPERFEKIYLNWIDNLRDWCISRQVWWGHRIPVWYRTRGLKLIKGELGPLSFEEGHAEMYCGIEPPDKAGKSPLQKNPDVIDSKSWTQDPDTLDTWFSSGLWTFSTLLNKDFGKYKTFEEWKKNSPDLVFHPTSWMQMGYELLFFWMARMILMSTYALNEIPFNNAYIHGILRDELGKKFSKSAGNNVDPVEVSDKFGTDALRLSLVSGITPGEDSRFYEEKIESARKFTNKLWNIGRYIIQNTRITSEQENEGKIFTLADEWISNKLKGAECSVTKHIEKFRFSQAIIELQYFTWDEFANWYIEIYKSEKNDANKALKDWILRESFEKILKLWHPFMPFITETLWKELGKEKMLIIEAWPIKEIPMTAGEMMGKRTYDFEFIKGIIISIRNARTEHKIDPNKKIKVIIDTKNMPAHIAELITEQKHLIKSLRTGICELEIKRDGKKVKNSIHRAVTGINIYIPMEGLIDIEKEKIKYQKETDNLEKYIAGVENKLKDKNFLEKAPENIINQQKEGLEKAKVKLGEIRKHLKSLS